MVIWCWCVAGQREPRRRARHVPRENRLRWRSDRHDLAQSELLDLPQGVGAHPGERRGTQDCRLYQGATERCRLRAALKAMEMGPRDLLRRRGTPYDELGLGDETLSDAALIEAMHAHPILIERPVVQSPKGARLCRPAERVADIL